MSAEHDLELYRLKAELCKAFTSAKRLLIISTLRDSEKTVGELSKILEVPHAVVSRHLAILRDRGLAATRRQGKSVYYCLTDSKIGEACDLVHLVLLNKIRRSRELAEKMLHL